MEPLVLVSENQELKLPKKANSVFNNTFSDEKINHDNDKFEVWKIFLQIFLKSFSWILRGAKTCSLITISAEWGIYGKSFGIFILIYAISSDMGNGLRNIRIDVNDQENKVFAKNILL